MRKNVFSKKIALLAFVLLSALSSIIIVSCSGDESSDSNSTNPKSSQQSNSDITNKKEFHIHFANWDGWGRTSRECDGFGLCHYDDCWFCCTENDVVVNCNEGNRISNSGEITIFDDTKLGYLTIKLDPNDSEHLAAINNREILYIDNNISSVKTTLHKGEYEFDPSVGEYGGYIVTASENK